MQHGQHIDLRLRRDPIDDQIWQPDHRELACVRHLPGTAQHRELPEHHRRLHNPGNYPVSGALIIPGDPVADRLQIVPRLRRENNDQA